MCVPTVRVLEPWGVFQVHGPTKGFNTYRATPVCLLQASLYGIIFDELDRSGHWKVLASMCVGLAMALYKLMPVWRYFAVGWTGLFRQGALCEQRCSALFTILLVTSAYLSGLVFIAWIIAKIYFAFTCPDHLWGLTTGCVFMNSTDHAHSHHADLWPF